MARAGEEPARVLGMGRRDMGSGARHDEEPRHVLGFPVDWFGPAEEVRLPSLRHPVKAYKRWARIRRLGPYAPEDEDAR